MSNIPYSLMHRMLHIGIFLLLFLAQGAFHAHAEDVEITQGTFSGKVFLSDQGASLPFEQGEITLLTTGTSTEPVMFHAYTDASGTYSIPVPFGVYDICIAPDASHFVQQDTPTCYEQIAIQVEQGIEPIEISPFVLEKKYELRLLGESPLVLEFGQDFYELDPGAECYDRELQATTSDFIIDMSTDFDASVPSPSYSAQYSISQKTYEGVVIAPVIRSIILKEEVIPVPEVKEPEKKHTSRVIGSSGSSGGGRSVVQVQDAPSLGEVAGAYDEQFSCELLANNPTTFLSSTLEIFKMQLFLSLFEDAGPLSLTGIYDGATKRAVELFQKKYRTIILEPLGLSIPTGYVGVRTIAKINDQFCKIVKNR